MAVIARRRNVDRMLERRYLSGTTHHPWQSRAENTASRTSP
jgi:hypothetical protein